MWLAKLPLDYMLHNTFPCDHLSLCGEICPQPNAAHVTVALGEFGVTLLVLC